jgi:hypothetical protein
VLLVKIVNFVDFVPQCNQRSDDRTGARPKYKIKSLIERAFQHTLDLFENAESIEALGASAVKGKDTTNAVTLIFGRQSRTHREILV